MNQTCIEYCRPTVLQRLVRERAFTGHSVKFACMGQNWKFVSVKNIPTSVYEYWNIYITILPVNS